MHMRVSANEQNACFKVSRGLLEALRGPLFDPVNRARRESVCATSPHERSEMRTIENATEVVHLTTDQLARRWNMNPGSIRNMLVEGSAPPHLKIRRSVRFALAAVEAYEETNTYSSTTRGGGQ